MHLRRGLSKLASGLRYFGDLAKECFALLRKHAAVIKKGCALAFLLLLVLVTVYVAMHKLGLLGREIGGLTKNRGGPEGNPSGSAMPPAPGVKGELATKASNQVASALSTKKQDLQMARGELGTLIARNHEEIDTLRRLGERDYVEFSIEGRGKPQKVGNITVELRGTNPKRNLYNVAMVVGDTRVERKNRAINEPIFFYTRGTKQPLELVVNEVGKNKIVGYLSIPKVNDSADERRARAEADQRAEAARLTAARAQQQAAQAGAEQTRRQPGEAEQRRQQAEKEKAQLRAQILRQLNAILETRETPRGLVVNMADVLFDSDKYTLKPLARERLAKIAGLLLAHPGLKLELEGHTGSVSSGEFSQRLSEQRVAAVRDYLVAQGISMNSIAARGFGKEWPIASNDTADGRLRNRRVELIVSGEVIGIAVGPSASTPR